jgi:acyl carrier protein
MNTDSLTETVRNRLAILIDVPPSSIKDDTPFLELDVDSLMLLELVALIEQRVGFELPEEDLGRLRTLRAVQEYVAAVDGESTGVRG